MQDLSAQDLPVIDTLCRGCGACCLYVGRPPFCAGDAEFDELPEDLRREVESIKRPEQPTPCAWFDEQTRRCTHYEHRPPVCREFEVDSQGCKTARELVKR